jgi:hypothetical protein
MTTSFTKKNIALPKGEVLQVDMSDRFFDVVKEHFALSSIDEVNDDHIRMYVWGALKNAIDKAEKESAT